MITLRMLSQAHLVGRCRQLGLHLPKRSSRLLKAESPFTGVRFFAPLFCNFEGFFVNLNEKETAGIPIPMCWKWAMFSKPIPQEKLGEDPWSCQIVVEAPDLIFVHLMG